MKGTIFGQTQALGQIVEVTDDAVWGYLCHQVSENEKFERFFVSVRDPNISEEQKKELLNAAQEKISTAENGYNVQENAMEIKQGGDCQYL